MEQLMNYLKQPSTYRGITTLGAVFGLGIPTTVVEALCQGFLALYGAYSVIRDEYKGSKKLVEKIESEKK